MKLLRYYKLSLNFFCFPQVFIKLYRPFKKKKVFLDFEKKNNEGKVRYGKVKTDA